MKVSEGPMHAFAGVLGVAIVLIVLSDAFETIILPRRVARKLRVTALFLRLSWRPWAGVVRHVRNARRREGYLSYYGPLSTLVLVAVWAAGLVLGFATLLWALGSNVHDQHGAPGFALDLYFSGTTFFTLGLGDVLPLSPAARFLTVIEGGLGFAFLALIISYLPVLYQSFSRREVNISLMDARAGSPSTAAEVFRRYRGHLDRLESGLHELEHWTADLLESQISYPMLSYFRSQHDNQSWVQSLTTVLDVCSLVMAGIEGAPVWQAELTFAMARHAAVDLAQVLRAPPRPPQPDRLDNQRFAHLRTALGQAGARFADEEGARQRLSELRRMYEPYVSGLSEHLLMRLPDWINDRDPTHNWRSSAWGRATAPLPSASGVVSDGDHW